MEPDTSVHTHLSLLRHDPLLLFCQGKRVLFPVFCCARPAGRNLPAALPGPVT